MQYNFFKWIDPRASKLGAILSVMVASMITDSELLSWYYCICQKGRNILAQVRDGETWDQIDGSGAR